MKSLKCISLIFLLSIAGNKIQAQVWGVSGSRTDYRDDAGLQGNAGALSGFFQTYKSGEYPDSYHYPQGAGEWWHLLDVRHDNPSNNYAMQFAGSFFDQQLFFRKTNNNPAQLWSKVLLEDNNGFLSTGKLALKTSAGQSFFTGHQAGAGYSFGSGIFRAITDNPNGASNYYFDGVTNGTTNFSVRADGRGYFAGNVGIGVDAPQSFLHLKSLNNQNDHIIISKGDNSANLDTYSVYNGNDDIQTGSFGYGVRPSDDSWQIWETHSGAIWNNLFTVKANGFVGIGTSTPAEHLSVNGKIRAKEIKVEAAPWPDYVFSKEHKLPPLSDIESYIKTNNHLPEIPSAKEVEKDGVSLGEMNAKLLKKIEELTLYMIELNSIVKNQQKEIDQLKDKK